MLRSTTRFVVKSEKQQGCEGGHWGGSSLPLRHNRLTLHIVWYFRADALLSLPLLCSNEDTSNSQLVYVTNTEQSQLSVIKMSQIRLVSSYYCL